MDEITVIGSINIDFMVKTERMPERGETVAGDNFYILPGGKGANQAVAIARLGKKVNFVAKKGKDQFADTAMKNLNHPNAGSTLCRFHRAASWTACRASTQGGLA